MWGRGGGVWFRCWGEQIGGSGTGCLFERSGVDDDGGWGESIGRLGLGGRMGWLIPHLLQ